MATAIHAPVAPPPRAAAEDLPSLLPFNGEPFVDPIVVALVVVGVIDVGLASYFVEDCGDVDVIVAIRVPDNN